MPRTTLIGVLLFLAIPAVLVLFLRQPFGPAASVALGIGIMLGHRFVAAPFARRHASERCAWCGGGAQHLTPSPEGPDLRASPVPWRQMEVVTGGETWHLAACCEQHGLRVARFLTLLNAGRAAIAAGIFVPLALLLVGSLARAGGWSFIRHEANALQFRVIVAVTVVSASLGYLLVRRPDEHLQCPFPLHNLLLLGMRQTLWIFRLVGAWWIVDGMTRLMA